MWPSNLRCKLPHLYNHCMNLLNFHCVYLVTMYCTQESLTNPVAVCSSTWRLMLAFSLAVLRVVVGSLGHSIVCSNNNDRK